MGRAALRERIAGVIGVGDGRSFRVWIFARESECIWAGELMCMVVEVTAVFWEVLLVDNDTVLIDGVYWFSKNDSGFFKNVHSDIWSLDVLFCVFCESI